MTTYDFAPLFRSTIGFDRLANLVEDALRADAAPAGFPPYNIARHDEDAYRITLAVAGFRQDDLSIETHENMLVVTGKPKAPEKAVQFLHRGIGEAEFTRSFRLADHVKVTDAHLENGLLTIDLVRELPERMRPRRIEIATSPAEKLLGKAKKVLTGSDKAA